MWWSAILPDDTRQPCCSSRLRALQESSRGCYTTPAHRISDHSRSRRAKPRASAQPQRFWTCHWRGHHHRRPVHEVRGGFTRLTPTRRRHRSRTRRTKKSRPSARSSCPPASGEGVSAREVMTAHLAQIERVNPRVNAIVTLVADRAMADAARADEMPARGGPLGVAARAAGGAQGSRRHRRHPDDAGVALLSRQRPDAAMR